MTSTSEGPPSPLEASAWKSHPRTSASQRHTNPTQLPRPPPGHILVTHAQAHFGTRVAALGSRPGPHPRPCPCSPPAGPGGQRRPGLLWPPDTAATVLLPTTLGAGPRGRGLRARSPPCSPGRGEGSRGVSSASVMRGHWLTPARGHHD